MIEDLEKLTHNLGNLTKIQARFERRSPAIKEKDLKAGLRRANEFSAERTFSFKFGEKSVWIKNHCWLVDFEQKRRVSRGNKIDLNDEKIVAFVKDNFDKEINRDPGTTEVWTVDGEEKRRKNGAVGRAIDDEKTTQAVRKLVVENNGEKSVAVVTKNVPPIIKRHGTFSKS